MTLDDYYSADGKKIRITPEQASRFAKEVAGDFNPIHDPDAKRFCVPGDLLFALVLEKCGLNRRMRFSFTGMVGSGVALVIPELPGAQCAVCDETDKPYLQVDRSGPASVDRSLIAAFTQSYVAFSGQNFPHILVPLMAEHRVMINTERPLVVYESMALDLQRLDLVSPVLELAETRLDVRGKRGKAHLTFYVKNAGEVVGMGRKKLVLSGLRAFDEAKLNRLVERFDARRTEYLALRG